MNFNIYIKEIFEKTGNISTIIKNINLSEYNRKQEKIGRCLIISNSNLFTHSEDKEGTMIDAQSVEKVFKDIGYEIEKYEDKTSKDMLNIFENVAKEDHKEYNSFLCIVLCYGIEKKVYGAEATPNSDNGFIYLDQIINCFKGDQCKSLAGKPKLFLIQICGKKNSNNSNIQTDSFYSNQIISRVPIETDILFSYSAIQDYKSVRHQNKGSLFIQAICTVFQKYKTKMDVVRMMTVVCQCVADCLDSKVTPENLERKINLEEIETPIPVIVSSLRNIVYMQSGKVNQS